MKQKGTSQLMHDEFPSVIGDMKPEPKEGRARFFRRWSKQTPLHQGQWSPWHCVGQRPGLLITRREGSPPSDAMQGPAHLTSIHSVGLKSEGPHTFSAWGFTPPVIPTSTHVSKQGSRAPCLDETLPPSKAWIWGDLEDPI